MTSPTPQSERRRAARAVATFPVTLSSKPGETPAALRDLSELGLACTAQQAIPEMTLVGLDFALPGQAGRHHVKGAVVRCEPIRGETKKKQWDVAVYFTELSPSTKAALASYVAKAKKA